MAIDGEDKGSLDTYDAASGLSDCKATALVTFSGLDNAQHSVVLTVEDGGSDTNHTTIQFVGFR